MSSLQQTTPPLPILDEVLLKEMFNEAVARSGTVGAQLSIVKGNQQLNFAAGYANALLRIPMTADTLLQIGSITKLFNAMIVASLVDEDLLELEAPLTAYLPELQIGDSGLGASITLGHLLSMTSGLDNGPYIYFGSGADALARYVASCRSLLLHFLPGAHFGYSNAGICIAGHVAARAGKQSWEELLRDRILRPAKLSQSALLDADVENQVIAAGHIIEERDAGPTVVAPELGSLRARGPSGPSLAMSMNNLARFGRIFLSGGLSDSGLSIVSKRAIEWMTVPRVSVPTRKYGDAWCAGPVTGDWNGVRVWGHGGTSPTATSFLYWIPKLQGVVAFVLNTHAAMGAFSEYVFDAILKEAFGFSKPPIDVPDHQLPEANTDRYIGRYEDMGEALEVRSGDRGTLIAHWYSKHNPQERRRIRGIQSATLLPLGGDRFLVQPTNGVDRHRGKVDIAFFGTDDVGRTTNVLNLVFPMSRAQ